MAFCLLIAAAFAVYAPALGGELIWDDFYLVGENPFFRSPVFGWEVFGHYLFSDSFSTYYRPIQNWSYILDYWLWRGSPVGYHFTNILLHAGSGWLLFLLLRRLVPPLLHRTAPVVQGYSNLLALLVAVSWVVHPVHNAAVAYISGRADSLASFFALAAWLAAFRAKSATAPIHKTGALACAVILALLALCSKEIALMWLVLYLAHVCLFELTWTARAKVAALAGVLSLVAIYAVLRALPDKRAPMTDAPPPALDARGLLALRALGDYTGLLIFPAKLHMERSLENAAAYRNASTWRAGSRPEWLSLIGLAAMLLAARLCWWNGPGRPLRCFGATWFALAFLPISNLFPLNAQVAEHWIYLASMGGFLFVAGCVVGLPMQGQRFAFSFFAVVIVAWGARTFVRSGDWVSPETFYARTIAAGGGTPRVLSSLAAIYGQKGDLINQESLLRKMLVLFPDFTPARINLGICLRRQGKQGEAGALLDLGMGQSDDAKERFPRTWAAALNLAKIRQDAGQADAASEILREARARFPDNWDLVKFETTLLRGRSENVRALAFAEAFAQERWWHLDARLTLAECRAANQDFAGAREALATAARLDIYDTRALLLLTQLELQLNRPDEALVAQVTAMEREPGQPKHYVGLSAILDRLGRHPESRGAIRKAELLVAEARGL